MNEIQKKEGTLLTLWGIFMAVVAFYLYNYVVPNKEDDFSTLQTVVLIALFVIFLAGALYIDHVMSKRRICPKCGKPTGRVVEKIVLVEATLEAGGNGINKCRCEHCHHEWEEPFELDCLNQAASDDDDDRHRSSDSDSGSGCGGSFGGGSSSGGGAGSSW